MPVASRPRRRDGSRSAATQTTRYHHPGYGIAGPDRGGQGGLGPGARCEPASVKKPRVRRSGRKLVCRRGSWSNNPNRYSYRWLVNGKRKRGARGRTLGVTRKLRVRKVQCRVTAYNAAGATTALAGRCASAEPHAGCSDAR